MRSATRIPNFSLYGETAVPTAQGERVHIEDIQSRSRKYLWRIGTHRHTLLSQCLWLEEGPATAILEEQRTALSGPAILVIPAGTVHAFEFRETTRGHVLTIDLARLLEASGPAFRPPIEALYATPRVLELRGDAGFAARLKPHFELLVREFARPEASQGPVCTALAAGLLWIIAVRMAPGISPRRSGTRDAERLRRFRELIERAFLEHWPVRRYARRLGLSETSLNRLCRLRAGCSASELIQERLALEARRRLIHGASAIGGIATELGFKDPAYFSRFFRRRSGASPQQFRRRHQGG